MMKAETLTLPETGLWIADESERCEDCPDINPNPPTNSDCPDFEMTVGGPVCKKQSELQRMIGGGGNAGTGVSDCNTCLLNASRITRLEEIQ